MAKGDKRPVVMQGDRGAANGIATLDVNKNVPYEQLGNVVRPNLLHNWYFANCVNQRGQTEYLSTGYTVDGWKIMTADTSVTVSRQEDGENRVTLRSTGSVIGVLRQVIENHNELLGKTITISVLLSDGSFASKTGTVPSQFPADDASVAAAILDKDGSGRYCALFIGSAGSLFVNLKVPPGGEMTVAAVKLELGSVQTMAHQDSSGKWVLNEIPDYGTELAKCQRYYQLFSSADKRPTALVDYRPAMRTTPRTGTITIDGVTRYYADANL